MDKVRKPNISVSYCCLTGSEEYKARFHVVIYSYIDLCVDTECDTIHFNKDVSEGQTQDNKRSPLLCANAPRYT
jgi:hypothetical protein